MRPRLFFFLGADASGGGSEKVREDGRQHGGRLEDQPEAHQRHQECVGRSCELLQGEARNQATACAEQLVPGQRQVILNRLLFKTLHKLIYLFCNICDFILIYEINVWVVS